MKKEKYIKINANTILHHLIGAEGITSIVTANVKGCTITTLTML